MTFKRPYIALTAAFMMIIYATTAAWAEIYTFDAAHSSIGFAVKHLSVGTTKGVFDVYEGTIEYDPDKIEDIKLNVTIQAASINTRQQQRDEHLRNEDFFDVANYPVITFNSVGSRKVDDTFWVAGDLTIKKTTKRVSIPVTIQGPINNPFGVAVLGISAKFEINRQDYGVSWNKTLDQGGYVISDIVEAEVFVEANPVAAQE